LGDRRAIVQGGTIARSACDPSAGRGSSDLADHPDRRVADRAAEDPFAGTIDRIWAGARPHPLDDPGAWPTLLDEDEAGFTALVERERATAGTAK
jgi:hypothetical protein